MLEQRIRKAGIGLALISSLMSGCCGFVATQRNSFDYKPLERTHARYQLEIKGYVPHEFKFYFGHPKPADTADYGRVEPKNSEQYLDTFFNDCKN